MKVVSIPDNHCIVDFGLMKTNFWSRSFLTPRFFCCSQFRILIPSSVPFSLRGGAPFQRHFWVAERSIIEMNGEKSSKLAPWCLFNMLVWQSMNKRSASGLPRDTVGPIQLGIQPQPRQCCNIVFEYFCCSS